MATNGDKISSSGDDVETNGVHTSSKTGLDDVVLIDELPAETWSLGTSVRPNGDAFITRLNAPELYLVHLTSSSGNPFLKAEPELVHTFADATSAFNMCHLKSSGREEYAVLTATVNIETAEIRNYALWRVVPPADDATEDTGYVVTKIANIPGAQFCVGMIAVSESVLLIGDSVGGCIYHVDMDTGVSSIFHDDETMRPATKKDALGLGCMCIHGNYLLYTNTSRGTVNRLPVQWAEDHQNLELVGPAHIMATGLANADGMTVTKDGRAAYIASFTSGTLWKVDLDIEAGKGVGHILRERMPNPTAMELVYSEDEEEPALYVVCCGFAGDQWRENIGIQWLNIFHVDRSIMVTTETLITYEPNPDYIQQVESAC